MSEITALIESIEKSIYWNRRTAVDIEGDIGYDGGEFGNVENKLEMLQEQNEKLLELIKILLDRLKLGN